MLALGGRSPHARMARLQKPTCAATFALRVARRWFAAQIRLINKLLKEAPQKHYEPLQRVILHTVEALAGQRGRPPLPFNVVPRPRRRA